jgi:hypothetical protein
MLTTLARKASKRAVLAADKRSPRRSGGGSY